MDLSFPGLCSWHGSDDIRISRVCNGQCAHSKTKRKLVIILLSSRLSHFLCLFLLQFFLFLTLLSLPISISLTVLNKLFYLISIHRNYSPPPFFYYPFCISLQIFFFAFTLQSFTQNTFIITRSTIHF